MLPRKFNLLPAIFLVIVALALIRPMSAQVFDLDKDRFKIVELDGLWRFHTGDDPRWSDPNFDDSSWPLLRSNQPWTAQGYKGYGGMAWYRFNVLVPEKHKQLQLLIPYMTTSYQVFADGKLIGEVGGMPPNQRVSDPLPHIFSLLGESTGPVKTVSIAIRIWHWPNWATFFGGGPLQAPFIGEPGRVEDWREAEQFADFWELAPGNILLLINLLAGLASLALFWLRRTEREYLWFGLSELLNVAERIRYDYWAFYDTWFVPTNLLGGLFTTGGLFFFVLFIVTLLKSRKGWLYWIAVAALAIGLLLSYPMSKGWSVTAIFVTMGIQILLIYVCILVLLVIAARHRDLDAQLLLPPVALWCAAYSFGDILEAVVASGRTPLTLDSFSWYRYLSFWPFPFSVKDVANLLVQLSILVILLMRFARTRRDEQRMATELESARTVQNVLIPSEISEVPGFSIASVYKPATQVGGDLFQIIPNGKGGVLVVIGDVSGKGMPAAMTVSLLVGTIRTLAHYTQSPGEILSAMNVRMLTRSAGGFTTCLVLRADPDGTLTIANAGHIAPYLNGVELPLENGLPLGIEAASKYVESAFRLANHEQLTLMTDGVIEARSKTGELYGFERTAEIASNSAEHIARAAQEFGQDDDITVVTLSTRSVGESARDQISESGE